MFGELIAGTIAGKGGRPMVDLGSVIGLLLENPDADQGPGLVGPGVGFRGAGAGGQ